MNKEDEYRSEMETILREDPRYPEPAYEFVAAAVSHTARELGKTAAAPGRRHISGRELLEGIREIALRQFGPLTYDVLEAWGITRTEDFGSIVFNLVNHGLLGASEEDSPEDFADGYDFIEAFCKPFVETGSLPDDMPKIA
jgi:uncharacterized repeat protein (TIGR04138 family)